MPNWVPGETAMYEFNNTVRSLLTVRVSIMEQDFPLTIDEIEACTTPAVIRGYFDAIRKAGITAVKTTRFVGFVLTQDHGTKRRIAVKAFVPRPIYYSYEEQVDEMQMRSACNRGHTRMPFDSTVLTPEKLNALVIWAEKVTEEKRRAELTQRTVKAYLDMLQKDPTKRGKEVSLALMVGRWPALRVLCSRIPNTYRMNIGWEARVRELPQDLSPWRWPAWGDTAVWREKHRRQMYLAEETLISAVNLVKPEFNSAVVHAEVLDWEKLNGQPI